MKQYKITLGYRYPPGAKVDSRGVNFSIFSRYATYIELLLYEKENSTDPFQIIPLDPEVHRTFFSWHVYVEGLPVGRFYNWRVDGPETLKPGLRFDKQKALLDPWARAVTYNLWERARACQPGENLAQAMRSVVVDEDDYDWEGDQPLNHSSETMIIYEMHVGGFTRHPSSKVTHPGTFAGLIEKIPYLKKLGITDVELMPSMAFDEQDVPGSVAARGLKNYWGYSTHSFYSPHPGYCVSPEKGTHLREFRDMVKALHNADIGVILDVVFNHTSESGADGPLIHFRGLANTTFYHLDFEDPYRYRDYTGCGNTINCNHPMVAGFIVECLEFWVREMHVDGFRFDLASAMARGEDGRPMRYPPVLWNIESSDVLAHTKIIAEAWDAAGLYQVGDFPGYRWAEWNGRYRDVIRRFVRGDKGLIAEVATCVSGSSDLYQAQNRLPSNSINFVTCHDGFTLYDLVSYNGKHNEANGEDNRDGSNNNHSWNCGREGPTDKSKVLSLRLQQAKNFMAILFLSQGVPMILAGDEVLRTQAGNNNTYCQDNELGWFDWTLIKSNQELLRFVRYLSAFRKRHPCLMRRRFLTGTQQEGRDLADVTWHGSRLNEPLWMDSHAQILSYTLGAFTPNEEDVHIMMNMSDDRGEFFLPQLPDRKWFRVIDTALPSPIDIVEPHKKPVLVESTYASSARSVVVLESREEMKVLSIK